MPHGELSGELRAIARDDLRAQRDERRLANRPRADLLAAFPAALVIAGDDLGAPTTLKLAERWPTHDALAAATRDELEAFARQAQHGWPDRFADHMAQTLANDHFTAKPYLVRAKTDAIRPHAAGLLLLRAQRRA
ncbi:hypothetical protein [Novosphingobium sp.]|uniref:hypothetical protein n=1 Tax=Novosphingobium sp. TaxID=1874826 RepID=UPI003D6D8C64